MEDGERKAFDPFELFVALLLGLGAIGSAWAGYQGSLWGGNSSTAYGEAATMATQASTTFSTAVTQLVRDVNLDVDAKRTIIEGAFSEDPTRKMVLFSVASYLYAQQMSDTAYAALALPPQFRTKEGRDAEPVPHMPEPVLMAVIERDLVTAQGYRDEMLRAGREGFAASARKFDEGREANETGDRFSLDGVLYAIAMFLAGISLVFKSGVRWGFAAMGLFALIAAAGYMFTIPWA
jgi:hypothetical protein